MRLRHLPLAIAVAVALVGLAGAATAPTNERPLAEAGLDRSVDWGTPVYLDAAGSRDPDGEIVDYEWTIEAPNGSTTAPRCPGCVRTAFRPTRPGEYAVTVSVTDDDGATANDTLYVTVDESDPPSVDLSGPPSIEAGDVREYTARIERGDAALTRIRWTLDGRPLDSTSLDGAGTQRVSVSLPDVGDHVLRATVADRANNTVTDRVRIAVSGTDGGGRGDDSNDDGRGGGDDDPPVSRFSVPESVSTGTTLTLDGGRSTDPDGRIASYQWRIDGRSLSTNVTAETNFSAPGTYEVTLAVTDDQGLSDATSHTIRAVNGSVPPVAVVDAPRNGTVGERVRLDATDSYDPDGGRLQAFEWRGDVEGSGSTTAFVPSRNGTYETTLTVEDDEGRTDTATVAVVVGRDNQPPTPRIEAPSTASVGESVAFDGTLSSDPDGDDLRYEWSFPDGTADEPVESYSFSDPGTYEVALTVRDGTHARTATHEIAVGCANCSAGGGSGEVGGSGDVWFEIAGPSRMTVTFDRSYEGSSYWNFDPIRAEYHLDRPVVWGHWKLIDPSGNDGNGEVVWSRNVTAGGAEVIVPLQDVPDLQEYGSLLVSVTASANDADTGETVTRTDSYQVNVCTTFEGSRSTNCNSDPELPDPGVDVDGPYSLKYGESGQLSPTMKNERLYDGERYHWESLDWGTYVVERRARNDEVLEISRRWDPQNESASMSVDFQLTTFADFRDEALDVDADKRGNFSNSHEVTFSAIDTDEDGVPNKLDNCPHTENSKQLDADDDGIGDRCDNSSDSPGGSGDGEFPDGDSDQSGGSNETDGDGGSSDQPCDRSGYVKPGCDQYSNRQDINSSFVNSNGYLSAEVRSGTAEFF